VSHRATTSTLPFGLDDRRQRRRLVRMRVLFLLGLLMWTSLAVWWGVYFQRTTRETEASHKEALASLQQLYALRLATDPATPLPASLALTSAPLSPEQQAMPHLVLGGVDPDQPGTLVVSDGERHRLTSQTRRKLLMLAGEGSVLIGLLFVVLAALYRMLLAEWRVRRQQEAFMHAVTHELRTPAAGLRALLQTSATVPLSDDERRELTALGIGELDRLDRLVSNILLSTRLESDAFAPQQQPVALAPLLERLVERVRRVAPTARMDVATVPLALACDPQALESILQNLLDNALKYAGPTAQIGVQAWLEGGRVLIRVTDDGIGLSGDELARIFEKFYRAPAGQKQSARGSGLGLYLARGLAQAMGGDLTAHSDGPGRGAAFCLVLPAGREAESLAGHAVRDARPA